MIRLSEDMVYDDTEFLNSKIGKLKSQLFISRMYGIIMTCIAVTAIFTFMKKNNESLNDIFNIKEEYEQIISDCRSEYLALQKDSEYAYSQLQSMSNTILELTDISTTLSEYNEILQADNIELMNTIDIYQSREELFNKYEYALFDTAGKRTDITYEQLPMVEDLIENSSIPSTDMILALVMTESGGDSQARNSESTAKGYGQFLDTTSKFVYTNLLNNSGWTPSVALDGTINLQMIVAYFDYLYSLNNYNLIEAIKDYRGKEDVTHYVAKINSYLSKVDKSVGSISLLSIDSDSQ